MVDNAEKMRNALESLNEAEVQVLFMKKKIRFLD